MLAAQASTGGTAEQAKGAEYDLRAREPVMACIAGFALMGVMLFLIFEKGEGMVRPAGVVAKGRGTALGSTGEAPVARGNARNTGEAPVAQGQARSMGEAPVAQGQARSMGEPPMPREQEASAVRALGAYLFKEQLVTLEIAGVLLTISMVGAIVIARRQVESVLDMDGLEVEEGAMLERFDPGEDDPHAIPVYTEK
jgi:hypothetical protein